MEEASIEVEAVTPIFIAGADQKSIENEGLRAPSLKGLLRWWFRAIMGGIVSVTDLRELENKIFGSIDQKSQVKIRSITNTSPSGINIPNSLRYLWFSIYLQKRKNQRLQCYPPGTKFKIILNASNKSILKIALGCLWTLIHLGGIGARMRRGAGSLKVNKVNYIPDDVPYTFILTGNTINDAKRFMEENLRKIFRDFKEYAGKKCKSIQNPNFAVLSKNYSRVSLVENFFNSWEEALAIVSNVYQRFRQGKKVQHRYTLGLPIISYPPFKELRQASPLFIGVMNLGDKYVVRIVKFYTSINPNFLSNLRYLEQDLNNLDSEISQKLKETEIKLPEVK